MFGLLCAGVSLHWVRWRAPSRVCVVSYCTRRTHDPRPQTRWDTVTVAKAIGFPYCRVLLPSHSCTSQPRAAADAAGRRGGDAGAGAGAGPLAPPASPPPRSATLKKLRRTVGLIRIAMMFKWVCVGLCGSVWVCVDLCGLCGGFVSSQTRAKGFTRANKTRALEWNQICDSDSENARTVWRWHRELYL